jgi:hypothetical protein
LISVLGDHRCVLHHLQGLPHMRAYFQSAVAAHQLHPSSLCSGASEREGSSLSCFWGCFVLTLLPPPPSGRAWHPPQSLVVAALRLLQHY